MQFRIELSIRSSMITALVLFAIATGYYCVPMPEIVHRAFVDNEIVPDVLDKPPKEFLLVKYPSGAEVGLGNILTPTQTKDKPQVSWSTEKGAYYSLILADADTPSREDHVYREVRHWFVMNIPESAVEKGDEVFGYIGAGPPRNTGLHRYIFLVYKQPRGKIKHSEPRASNKKMAGRPMTSTMKFAGKYQLGDPIYGCFFQAEHDAYSDELSKVLMG